MSRLDHPWRSRFYYGTGGDITDWATTLPVRPWRPDTRTVGGRRIAASGTPAAYVVRRDYLLGFDVRLFEDEVIHFEHMVRWGQSAETLLWYPDANITTESYSVYLDEPEPGGTWTVNRDQEGLITFDVPVVLRRADNLPWNLAYFACD